MKNLKSLITIVISIASLSSHAQFSRINAGINGGLNLASLHGNKYSETHHYLRPGYVAGVFVEYNLSKTYSFQTGISYQTKGAEFDYGSPEIFYGKNNLEYLIIPLLAKVRSTDKLSFTICAGGYYGILLKEWDYYETIEFTVDRTQYYENYDAGITAGLGLSYPLSQKILLSLDVKNNWGLTDIMKDSEYYYEPTKTISTDFLLGVAYQF